MSIAGPRYILRVGSLDSDTEGGRQSLPNSLSTEFFTKSLTSGLHQPAAERGSRVYAGWKPSNIPCEPNSSL
jgi:hypothetical protein